MLTLPPASQSLFVEISHTDVFCALHSYQSDHILQRIDESVQRVSISQWVETSSVLHGLGLILSQAETDTKSESRLVKHRRAAAARRKTLLESLIQLAFPVCTKKLWLRPSGVESLWACKLISTCFYERKKNIRRPAASAGCARLHQNP